MWTKSREEKSAGAPAWGGGWGSPSTMAPLFIPPPTPTPGPALSKLDQPGVLFVLPEVLTPVLRPSFVLFSRTFPYLLATAILGLLFPILTT